MPVVWLLGYPQISAAKAHGLPAYRLASAGQELSSVMLGLQVTFSKLQLQQQIPDC
jgi:tRNA U55 pseudouridine synthase TruB